MTADKQAFTFYTDTLSWRIEETKAGKEYYISGYASTPDPDLVNDIVSQECMEDMFDQMLERVIKLDFEHEAFRGKDEEEKRLNVTKEPLGKASDHKIDDKGLFVEWKLNKNWIKVQDDKVIKKFQDVWASIEDGFLDAFSIAFIPIKTATKKIGDKVYRILEQVRLLNVGLTGNPINPAARMTSVVAKSLDYKGNYLEPSVETIMQKVRQGIPLTENEQQLLEQKLSKEEIVELEESSMDEYSKEEREIKNSHSSLKTPNSVDGNGGKHMSENQEENLEIKGKIEELEKQVKSLESKLEEKSEPSQETQEGADSDSAPEAKALDELKSELTAALKAKETAESELKALQDTHEEVKSQLAEKEEILSQPAIKGILEQREQEAANASKDLKSQDKETEPLDVLSA